MGLLNPTDPPSARLLPFFGFRASRPWQIYPPIEWAYGWRINWLTKLIKLKKMDKLNGYIAGLHGYIHTHTYIYIVGSQTYMDQGYTSKLVN